ncbi:MAG: hypothetical protein RJA22_2976 [Verrucomicrobiota bacterium]|jgi:hypothetical protein
MISHGRLLAFIAVASLSGWLLPAGASPPLNAQPRDWPANPARHTLVLERTATNAAQAALLRAAEAVLPTADILRQAAGATPVPAGTNVWWYKEELGVRIPCAITGEAVAYYTNLVAAYGRQACKRYSEPFSRVEYHARVAFHPVFRHQEKTFRDVHAVTLQLKFMQTFAATQTEGMHFEKERVVLLNAAGQVVQVIGDGPTEVPILAM